MWRLWKTQRYDNEQQPTAHFEESVQSLCPSSTNILLGSIGPLRRQEKRLRKTELIGEKMFGIELREGKKEPHG